MFAKKHTESPDFQQDLVVRGQKALRDALGLDGAMQFLQQMNAQNDTHIDQADGVKRTGLMIESRQQNEVVLAFTRPTTWVRFSADEAEVFVDKVKAVIKRARQQRAA